MRATSTSEVSGEAPYLAENDAAMGLTLGNEIDKLAANIALGRALPLRQHLRPLRRRATGIGTLAGLQPHVQRTLRRLHRAKIRRQEGEDRGRSNLRSLSNWGLKLDVSAGCWLSAARVDCAALDGLMHASTPNPKKN
jgi:hypothetical protein